MLRLAALGALGYVVFRYMQKNKSVGDSDGSAEDRDAVAGGPLSEDAKLQQDAGAPPRGQ